MEAENTRKRVAREKTSGLPEASKTVARESIENYRSGNVTGFIGKSKCCEKETVLWIDGMPMVNVQHKEKSVLDLDDMLEQSGLSEDESLL